MSHEELVFASDVEALQYLSNVIGHKILVAALTPSVGDVVVLLHPATQAYHVMTYPKNNTGFANEDAVVDLRSQIKKGNKYVDNPAHGQPMTFSGSTSPKDIAREINNMLAGLSANEFQKSDIKAMSGIYYADSLSEPDQNLRAGDLGFLFSGKHAPLKKDGKLGRPTYQDRIYHAIGRTGVIKSDKLRNKKKEEEEKALLEEDTQKRIELRNKKPSRYEKKVRRMAPETQDVSKGEIFEMFSSANEAIQHLADITGEKIKIAYMADFFNDANKGKPRPSFKTEEEAKKWMWKEVEDEEYVDNYRFGYEDDPKSIKEYEDILNNGCCGYFDAGIIVDGRDAFIGCNFGH